MFKTVFLVLCCSHLLTFTNSTTPKPTDFGQVYYVSTTGNDNNSGDENSPFLTLNGARNAIRNLKQSNNGLLPNGGVLVYVREGTYSPSLDNYQEPLLSLETQDAGTITTPIVYKSKLN